MSKRPMNSVLAHNFIQSSHIGHLDAYPDIYQSMINKFLESLFPGDLFGEYTTRLMYDEVFPSSECYESSGIETSSGMLSDEFAPSSKRISIVPNAV